MDTVFAGVEGDGGERQGVRLVRQGGGVDTRRNWIALGKHSYVF